MSIRYKIILSFIIVFLLFITIFIFVVGKNSKTTIVDLVHRRVESSARLKANQVVQYVNSEVKLTKQMAASEVIRDLLKNDNETNKTKVRGRLVRTMETEEETAEMLVADKDGVVLVSTNSESEGKKLQAVVDPVKTIVNGVEISDQIKDKEGKLYIWGKVPIVNGVTNELMGWYAQKPYLNQLNTIIADVLGDFQTIDVFLVNSDKYLLTKTKYLSEENILIKKIETVNTANCFSEKEKQIVREKTRLSGNSEHADHQSILAFRDYRNNSVIGTHAYISELNACLVVKVDESEAMIPYRQTMWMIGALFLISMTGFVMVGFVVSERITLDLRKLMGQVVRIQKGDLQTPVTIGGTDEVGILAGTVDQMRMAIVASRAEVDQKVKEQTQTIVQKGQDLEDQQKAVLNILEDVEEEKEKTKLERDRIDAVVHSIGDAVFVVDRDLKIVLVNQVALDLAGCTLDESLGKLYSSVFKFESEDSKEALKPFFITEAIETGTIREMANHTVLIQKDGKKVAVADSAAPLKNQAGQVVGCVIVFRDVTKEREVDRMKTEFISLASHQLRTPLSAMKWFTEMLIGGDAGKLTDKQMEFVNTINISCQRMIDLVNSLLNISRIESGRLIVDPKPTEITGLIQGILKEFQPKYEQKQQEVKLDIIGKIPVISFDPELIGEVYRNFISNANKYAPLKDKIEIKIYVQGNEVISEVRNHGETLTREEQSHVFTKFYRTEGAIKMDPEGNGLGLYLAKSIVDVSGGRIWVKSEKETGTAFSFSLPLSGSQSRKGEVTLS